MADIPSWLRNFPLGRTPYFTSQDARQSNYFEDIDKSEQDTSQMKPYSRSSSSFLDNGRASVPSRRNAMDPMGYVKEADRVVWHNPNPHQMAETLKVVMMTLGCFEPIPVQYNYCILHVLEAYNDMRLENMAKERKIREEEQNLADATTVHQKEEAEWMEREEKYKTELKKLEIILAGGERGLDLVTLARSKSTLRQEKKQAATFKDPKIDGQVKNGDCFSGMGITALMTAEFSAQKDARVSALLMSSRTVSGDRLNALTDAPATRRAHQGEDLKQPARASPRRIFRKHLLCNGEASGQHREESSESSGSASESDATPIPDLRDTVWLHYVDGNLQCPYTPDRATGKNKPLPEIPDSLRFMAQGATKKSHTDNKQDILSVGSFQHAHVTVNNLSIESSGFSFVPGDDCHENFLFAAKSTQQSQMAREIHPTEANLEIETLAQVCRRKQLGNNDPLKLGQVITNQGIPCTQSREISRGPLGCGTPQRNDSKNSVVTAVRDSSCRSDINIMSGHGEPNRHNRSSEAAIAAAHAIASSDRKDNKKLHYKALKDSEGHFPFAG